MTGGIAQFFNASTAGTATITNQGSAFAASPDPAGGWTRFRDSASAEQATIVNRGATANGGGGGSTFFSDSARAGSATTTNEAGTVAGALGGSLIFGIGASAENATIYNRAATVSGSTGGFVRFDGGTAGNAVFINEGQSTSGGGSFIEFRGGSTADAATVTTGGVQTAGQQVSALYFRDSASAGTAVITGQGGTVSGALGALTNFLGSSNAGSATITTQGASVSGAIGGRTVFAGNSSAVAATLVVGSGSNGGGGGTLEFRESAVGGTARVIVNAGGTLKIGDLHTFMAGLSTGSLEGAGDVILGGKLLQLGFNGRSTVFSGVIADGAPGGVFKGLSVIGGALTLTGESTYTTGTLIGNGATANSGKIVAANLSGSATGTGPVFVRRGGALSGSGFIAGPVTLQAGGIIAPGDPVTLTLESDLFWDSGSIIRLALGADQAGSDLLQINGALIRGETGGGPFTFDLVNFGAIVGQTYDLIHFASVQGFTAADFTFIGMQGILSLGSNSLTFTVATVPEPGALLSALTGGALLLSRRRRGQRI